MRTGRARAVQLEETYLSGIFATTSEITRIPR